MEQVIPTFEGTTPVMWWHAAIVIVAIMGLIVLYDKVRDVFRKRKKDREDEKAKEDGTIQGKLDKINKRLDSIDDYIRESDKRFDRDNRRINALEEQSGDINNGIRALARASLAHLQHDITGNHVETLKEAESMITDYLTNR